MVLYTNADTDTDTGTGTDTDTDIDMDAHIFSTQKILQTRFPEIAMTL